MSDSENSGQISIVQIQEGSFLSLAPVKQFRPNLSQNEKTMLSDYFVPLTFYRLFYALFGDSAEFLFLQFPVPVSL